MNEVWEYACQWIVGKKINNKKGKKNPEVLFFFFFKTVHYTNKSRKIQTWKFIDGSLGNI